MTNLKLLVYDNIFFILTKIHIFSALDKQFETVLPFEERLAWLWAALIVFGFPEVLTLFRSARICFFKTSVKPSIMEFMFVSI